jgi:hypothetical protein
MPPTRREVVTALGVSVVSVGCLSASPTDRSDDTSSGSPRTDDTGGDTPQTDDSPRPPSTPDDGRQVPMGTTVTLGETSLTVENPRVRKAVVTPGMAHTRVVANADQFVVADISVDGAPPTRPFDLALRPVVDGERRERSDPLPTTAERGYAFSFPASQHDDGAVQWATEESTVSWTLPQSVLDTLAREPAFAVTDFHVRRPSGTLRLKLTVRNEGDRDGQFAARVSFDGYSGGSIVDFPVPAGDAHSYTGRPGSVLQYFQNHGGETVTVEYPTDDGLTTIERTVDTSETTPE